ncbi:hypothetical protein [Kribbella sp. ALI-6-A]|uniref:hypothetical protein n=1 Tax=Kribbella sp. ALI-6-A TaxID=1933817 RepID=UPI00117B331A|nr:hypothetical protein [Kribbella sp. ALI-6-A]
MSRWREASTVLLVLCLVGCSDGSGSSADDAGSEQPPGDSTSAPVASETTDEPSVEPTEAEQPQPPQSKPAIKNAKLPVGGQVEFDAKGRSCFAPGWNGGELPSGVQIKVLRYELTDTSVVRFGSGSCPDGPACVEGSAFGSGATSCYLVLEKVGPGDSVLNLFGDVTCESEALCSKVQSDYLQAGGLTITVDGEVVPPEESPTPEESPSPEESPVPDETPSPTGTDG